MFYPGGFGCFHHNLVLKWFILIKSGISLDGDRALIEKSFLF